MEFKGWADVFRTCGDRADKIHSLKQWIERKLKDESINYDSAFVSATRIIQLQVNHPEQFRELSFMDFLEEIIE